MSEPTTAAGRALLVPGPVGLPNKVGRQPWPPTCDDCGFVTEDPDAYIVIDEEVTDQRFLCPVTGSGHRWERIDGQVRYIRPRTIVAIEAEARAEADAQIVALREALADEVAGYRGSTARSRRVLTDTAPAASWADERAAPPEDIRNLPFDGDAAPAEEARDG